MTAPREWTLVAPWPKPPLSLNDSTGASRGAKVARAKEIKRVRVMSRALAMGAGIGPLPGIHVRLHYRPADSRRRDADNLVATLKPMIDGLVDAGVVPDDCWPWVDWSAPRIHPKGNPPVPMVWLTITERIPNVNEGEKAA